MVKVEFVLRSMLLLFYYCLLNDLSFIYIYIYTCVCVCVSYFFFISRILSPLYNNSLFLGAGERKVLNKYFRYVNLEIVR